MDRHILVRDHDDSFFTARPLKASLGRPPMGIRIPIEMDLHSIALLSKRKEFRHGLPTAHHEPATHTAQIPIERL
jgi:hypothetical protein